MLESEFYVIAFNSTHHALQVENKLKQKFKIEVVPTPREISASCGLSIKFKAEYFQAIMEFLATEQEKLDVFKIEKKNHMKHVTKVTG